MLQDLDLVLAQVWPWAALPFGVVFGSFANVLIHRLPRGESVVHPPSACPRCGAAIRARDNLPILSWLLLRGRCRRCRAPISVRYPLVELANGLLWLLAAHLSGPTLRAAVLCLLATALLVLALIDLEHQLLPDAITLPGTALGLAASFLPGSPLSPLEAALSALGGYLLFALVARGWQAWRGVEALGQGDWKMAAMLGAFFGWRGLLLTVFLATLSGSLVGGVLIARRRGGMQSKLPLGSFLGVAGLAVLYGGRELLAWYAGFFPEP
jgi:leader peptidase (prepilin peptidase)/N-methyltransferase